MKKIFVFLLVTIMGISAHAQRYDTGWYASAGLNAINNSGTRNPLGEFKRIAINNPFMASIENRWEREFSIEQDLSLNGFRKGSIVNGVPAKKTLTYFSTNTNFKWYFTDYIFRRMRWLDFYASAGVGLFIMDELNTSGNLSLGGIYWFNDDIGIRAQATSKFAVDAKNHVYDNNHFQYVIMAIFRL